MLTDAVHEAVEEVVRRSLSSDRISGVDVQDDWDQDGEPLLRITVVFKSSPSPTDAQRMIRLIGALRSELRRLQTDSFPLVNFISKNEVAKLQRATA
jgi:hypothetical protein